MLIHTAVTFNKLCLKQIVTNCLKSSTSRQLFSKESRNLLGCDRDNDPRGSGRCGQFAALKSKVKVITKFAHRGSGRLEKGFLGFTNILVAQA